jgi:hypothetical protein
MVKIILLLPLFLSLAVLPAKAQSWTTQDSTKTAGEQRLERIEYVVGSAVAFSLFDYTGFNVLGSMHLKNDNKVGLTMLHLLDAFAGTGINYFLYSKFGLSSAISFDLIWWTWGNDMGFYGWTYLLNPASPWINRTNNGLRGGEVNWAGWTPVGLIRPQGSWIANSTLFAQSIIGFSISMAILW